MHSLFKNVEARRLTIDGTNYILAAGTSDVNSTIVDMQGYEGIAFVEGAGVIAGSGSVSIKVQEDTDSAGGTMTDLAGSNLGPTADTDDNKLLITEIFRPKKRYVRVVTTRGDGGNSTIDFLIALLYRPGQAAVTQGATVYGYETFNGPAEGTA